MQVHDTDFTFNHLGHIYKQGYMTHIDQLNTRQGISMNFLRGSLKLNRFTIIRKLSTMQSKVLKVEPYRSLIDQPVTLNGSGFEKKSKITIQSVLQCTEEHIHFMSYGHYLTSDNGDFDLKEMASLGGTYTGIDNCGLFWSMNHLEDSRDNFSLKDGRSILNYNFNIFDGHISDFSNANTIASANIQKCVLGEGICREEITGGNIRGTLFSPSQRGSYPAIITIFGGNKMGHVREEYAAYLAKQGYVTFALPFFGVDGLSKTYTEKPIEIEYFEEAIESLKSLDNVNGKIGILGHSKGGDIALGIMAHLSDINAVCTINGAIVSIGADVIHKGHVTKMIGSDVSRLAINADGTLDISNMLDNPRDFPTRIHQIQRSSADLLMIVGQEDKNWQSELFADIAQELMDIEGKKNYEIIKYAHSGHFFDLPNTPIVTKTTHPLVPNRVMVYFGGKDKAMFSQEIYKAWKCVFEFFRKSFAKTDSKL